MKFTLTFLPLALFATQVLAVAVLPPNIERRSLPSRETGSNSLKARQFKSALNCSTVPTCTSTCTALITEIEKCDFTKATAANVKCLCTQAFLDAALANYQCEVPLGLSNLKPVPGNNVDKPTAQAQLDTHLAQCKAIGVTLNPVTVTATGPPVPAT